MTLTSLCRVRDSLAFSYGAPSSPPPPPFPDPSMPEEAVQNQLHHFRFSDTSRAFREWCSPGFREESGSLADFERSLDVPPYDLITGHDRADVLLELRPDVGVDFAGEDGDGGVIEDAAVCLVRIRPGRGARRPHPVWFWWELCKRRAGDDDVSERGNARWMVDCIVPDFEDLDFEKNSLKIENFIGDEWGGDDGEDELTIYWDLDQ